MKKILIILLVIVGVNAQPVMVGGEADFDACSEMLMTKGLSSKGDGFAAVRSGPSSKNKIKDKIYGNKIIVTGCDRVGKWVGVVYGTEDCGVSSPISRRQSYKGSCQSGWIYQGLLANAGAGAHYPSKKYYNTKSKKTPLVGTLKEVEFHGGYTFVTLGDNGRTCNFTVDTSNIEIGKISVESNSKSCIHSINSNDVEIICTRNKSVCKTKTEVLKFVGVELDEYNRVVMQPIVTSPSETKVVKKVYSPEELFTKVNHQNTDLINRRLEKQLIGSTVKGVCEVTEVDESGSEYKVDCKTSSNETRIMRLFTTDVSRTENLKRGGRYNFTGRVRAIKAENDVFNLKTLDMDLI